MSAFSLAMPQSDPRLPLSAPDPAPERFIDKYQPQNLSDVVGQGAIIFELSEFVQAPYPCAFIFSGNTGIGKSTVAYALARGIGALEYSGLYKINSGMQDADVVLKTLQDCHYTPLPIPGSSGWKLIVVEECDHISVKARQVWLSALDNLPPKTVVVFTTNNPEKLEQRFIDRCRHLEFECRRDVVAQDVQTLCDHIADREGIPRINATDVKGIVDASGCVSFRRVAERMEFECRRHRALTRLDSPIPPPPPAPAPVETVPPPSATQGIPADVPPPPPVASPPPAEVAAPKRKRTATGKRRMSALETAETALASGNAAVESGPIRAIQENANPDHVWIRGEGSEKHVWRLHNPSPAGFVPISRTMDATDAIACVLAHASHKPIPVPPLADGADVVKIPPVKVHASRGDRRKRINALGSKLESRMQAVHERIKEYNGLVRSHVRAHLAVVHTSGSPEAIGTIRRARAALDKLRPIRDRLMFEFDTFNARLGKIGWNTWNGGERPSAIPVLMIPEWYSDAPTVAPPAEVAAPVPPPVATQDVKETVQTPPSRIRFDIEPITLDEMRDVLAVSLADPGHIRIRQGMQWTLHIADSEGTYWRQSGDSVGIVSVSRGIRSGSMRPVPVPTVIGFRPDPSPLPPVDPSPSAEVASGSQSDVAIMSVTVHSSHPPVSQHATSEYMHGIPCVLMTSAGRQSSADRIASRDRDRQWRRALSPLANRIRKPRPVPPPPSDPVPPPPPREFSGLTIGVKGQAYGLSVIPSGFRLESPKGDVYDVVTSTDEATSNHGYHCDCPSHRNTHAGVGTKGCKHVLALREVGLIPPIVPPVPPPPPSDPGPDGPPSPGPEFSESIDTVFAGDLPYLIREHTDMSGNRILSAWMRDNGDGRHTMTYTDAEGNRWGAMNSRLMHPRDVQAMQDASEFEQLQTAKDWRESQLEWCYATIEWARPDAIGGRRNYGTITIGPLAPPDPDRPRGIFDGIDGSIVLPPARSARPIPSESQDSGRRHTFGRVTLDRESGLIRIQFDSKPIAYERRLLREDGWRWDNEGGCWVKPYSEAAEDFAARYL